MSVRPVIAVCVDERSPVKAFSRIRKAGAGHVRHSDTGITAMNKSEDDAPEPIRQASGHVETSLHILDTPGTSPGRRITRDMLPELLLKEGHATAQQIRMPSRNNMQRASSSVKYSSERESLPRIPWSRSSRRTVESRTSICSAIQSTNLF